MATFLGQLITFVLHVAYLFKSKTFKLKITYLIPSKEIASILKFGISSLLTQLAIVIISIVNNILLFKYSANSGYDTAITQGVITLAFKVFGIVVSVAIGIASGAQPVIGYNYGAKKYDRVKKALLYMMIATVVVGVISTIIFEAVPQVFLLIFGNGGKGVDPVKYKSALLLGSSARFVLCNLPIALILLSIFANIILWKEIITILLLSALDRLARLAQRSCQRMAFPFW